jgi:hypothetical protein
VIAGQGFSSGSAFSSSSSGGSFGGGEVIKGESQVIDISGGGGAPSNVVYKPVFKEGPVQVNTHFYLHQSPEENLTPEERQKAIDAQTHKHYKIIFIKTPSVNSAAASGGAAIGPQVSMKVRKIDIFTISDLPTE